MIYNIMLEAPTDPEAREEYVAQMDETFFAECERELVKINLFFSQKIAEAQGKYHELSAELNTFKVDFVYQIFAFSNFIHLQGGSQHIRFSSSCLPPTALQRSALRLRFGNNQSTSKFQKEQSRQPNS
uniref:SPX domain-containing protein n=1 Tax=Ditylenchus dipsaci TaxID=166011 RepID=A0A915DMI7_9BILA